MDVIKGRNPDLSFGDICTSVACLIICLVSNLLEQMHGLILSRTSKNLPEGMGLQCVHQVKVWHVSEFTVYIMYVSCHRQSGVLYSASKWCCLFCDTVSFDNGEFRC